MAISIQNDIPHTECVNVALEWLSRFYLLIISLTVCRALFCCSYIIGSQWFMWFHYTSAQRSIGFTPSVHLSVHPQSVCPSVHPVSRVCSVTPTVLVGSISYLYTLSSNLSKYVACKVWCQISKFEFWQFFSIFQFDCLFLFGIWCQSLVWVIIGR